MRRESWKQAFEVGQEWKKKCKWSDLKFFFSGESEIVFLIERAKLGGDYSRAIFFLELFLEKNYQSQITITSGHFLGHQ